MIRLFDTTSGAKPTSRDFVEIQGAAGYAPARSLMERVFELWPARKAEFANDLRTRGFSARVWELALFAYFVERGYQLDTGHSFPDFVVADGQSAVAVEATTTNPREDGVPGYARRAEAPHIPADVAESADELVFQLAKSLRRKITRQDARGRRYWESEHLAGRPFVIAVEAFHGETALYHSDSGLATYLYGFRWTGERGPTGTKFAAHPVAEHRLAGKTIPSGFFFQEGTEHVSAVIFSNAGTVSQFQRIAIEHGLGSDDITVIRTGTCYNADPDAVEPLPSHTLSRRDSTGSRSPRAFVSSTTLERSTPYPLSSSAMWWSCGWANGTSSRRRIPSSALSHRSRRSTRPQVPDALARVRGPMSSSVRARRHRLRAVGSPAGRPEVVGRCVECPGRVTWPCYP